MVKTKKSKTIKDFKEECECKCQHDKQEKFQFFLNKNNEDRDGRKKIDDDQTLRKYQHSTNANQII